MGSNSTCGSCIAPAPDVRVAFFLCEREGAHRRHEYRDDDGLVITWLDTTRGVLPEHDDA